MTQVKDIDRKQVKKKPSPLKEALEGVVDCIKFVLRNRYGITGVVILSAFIIIALFPWLFTPYTPDQDFRREIIAMGGEVPYPPTPDHPLGIDQRGRDIWARVVYGTRVSLTAGILVALIATIIGVLVGSIAGYVRGKLDALLTLLSDVIMMIPSLLLILLAITLFREIWSIWHTIALIAIISWPSTARATRALTMQLASSGYVDAAKALGASGKRIITRHILPQVLPLAFARAAVLIAGAIVTVASLSFLIPQASGRADWGAVISDAFANWSYVTDQGMWLWFIVPGLFIALTVIGFICLGEALSEYFNPRLRKR
ncbi:ABC transporter permease [Desulfurococcaceae archaeon MEX13E-LK6-19]|nr:ABC transporter permease [Desulfurococcaceae archaeon MEX13E-LK6-19]